MANPYWEHRARLNQAAYDRANSRVAGQVATAYERTMRQLDEDIRTIIGTYQRKTGLSVREAWEYLREGVPESVMQDLLSRVAVIQDPRERNRLEVMLRTDRYRGRISRLDAIKASTRVGMTEAAEVELGALTPHLEGVGHLAYSRTMFDIQKATAGFQSVGIPRMGTILKTNWSGQHYSRSVWANRNTMSRMLDRAMMEMASMGKLSDLTMKDVRGLVDLDKWRRQLTTKFRDEQQYAKYAANRLIRTESAYVANQATAEAFEQAEIEKYAFVSVLDGRTSQVCGDLDGKIFDLSEKEVGVNYPPMHPHCRSHAAPVIDGLEREGLMRRGRDADGKGVLLPRDMNYAEWKRWQDDGAPSDVKAWRRGSGQEIIPHTLQNYEARRAEFIGEFGGKFDLLAPFERDYSSIMHDAFKEHELVIRAEDRDAIKILDDGRFKNQLETGRSGGSFDPNERKKISENLFGADVASSTPSDFEKYGYLADKNRKFEAFGNSEVSQYGDIAFVIDKEKVWDRTTYTMNDSYFGGKMETLVPQKIGYPSVYAYEAGEARRTETIDRVQRFTDMFKNGNAITPQELADRYIELQFHGEVGTEDIKMVYWGKGKVRSERVQKLVEALDARGIPWEEIESK